MAETKQIKPQQGPQEAFLASPADIAIYGGAAGGGKTWAILMEGLRHIANKDFGAVYFRRTMPQIKNEGGLWDESEKLYIPLGAKPNSSEAYWTFPSGAAVSFSHLEHDKSVSAWQGSQIPLICFDELTHFTKKQFWYMLSRNRSTCGIKPYIRATCNPDPNSFVADLIAWWINQDTGFPIPERSGVLRWFIRVNDDLVWGDSPDELAHYLDADGSPIPAKSLTFISAKLTDNKALMDSDPGYMANLMALDEVERGRLLGGNWKIKSTQARVFKNWRIEEFEAPADAVHRFGADWGFAEDPTVLVRCHVIGRTLYIDHEAYMVGCEIADTPDLFLTIPEAEHWPIVADSSRPETISHMRKNGFPKIMAAVKGPNSVKEGVEWLKSHQIVVHPRCTNVINELTLYSYKVDDLTGAILPILADDDNHTMDALRYACEASRRAAPKKAVEVKPLAMVNRW